MSHAIDFSAIPDHERVAYYGLLFAIAAADGTFDEEEMVVIHSLLDVTGMSEGSKQEIRRYRTNPPALSACLDVLSKSGDELRHGTMMSLADIALADGILTVSEERALDETGRALGISEEQVHAMIELIEEAADILNRDTATDLDNSKIRACARALAESGIGHSAAYFSATIARLISTARDAVASALNIGLGQIPGAPIAVIVGSTVQISVSEFLLSTRSPDATNAEERKKLRRERSHEAIEHLQSTIDELLALIEETRTSNSGSNHLEALESRYDGLRQLVRTRRSALEEG